jgi:hypothetical protein
VFELTQRPSQHLRTLTVHAKLPHPPPPLNNYAAWQRVMDEDEESGSSDDLVIKMQAYAFGHRAVAEDVKASISDLIEV